MILTKLSRGFEPNVAKAFGPVVAIGKREENAEDSEDIVAAATESRDMGWYVD